MLKREILKKFSCRLSLCLAWASLLAQQPLRNPVTALNETLHSRSAEGNRAALRKTIEARAVLLEQAIQADPEGIQELLLDPQDASRLKGLLPEAASEIEQAGPWKGELQITVEDDFQHGRSRTRWRVRTPESTLELFFGKSKTPGRSLKGGMQIHVEGVGIRGSIATRQIAALAPAPTSCTTTGQQNIAYLLATMPGGPSFPAGWTPSFVQQTAFGTTGVTLNNYWQESSYGKTSASGAVFGPFALPQSYTCDQSSSLESAVLSAAASTVPLSQYNRIAVICPASTCTYGGLGTLGCQTLQNGQLGSFAWFPIFSSQSTSTFPAILAHEHGHNLGLNHSSSADYGAVPLAALNNPGTELEYGDPFSVMGMTNQSQGSLGILGQYDSEHKSLFLGWLRNGSGYREIKSSGIYTILPYELASGLRALRVLRDPATDSWLWLEYRQPLGVIDSTLAHLTSNVLGGASIHYENPNLDSGHTNLLDFTPTGTPNNFFDAALASGQSWTDPATPLRITVLGASSAGLTVSVDYDAPCAVASLTSPGSITVSAPAGCSWGAATNDSWLSFTSPVTGQGNGTVTYLASANPSSTQRTGYITVQRQSIPVLQPGTGTTVFSASPNSGSGTSTTVTFTFNDAKTASYTDLSTVGVDFFGSPGCHVDVQVASRYAYLLNDLGTFSSPVLLANTSASVSNSQCTVLASGSSVSGSGQQLTLTLRVAFTPTFAGTHTVLASATDSSNATFGPFPVGSWTVPVTIPKSNIGLFQPNGPLWELDANGNGVFDGASGGDKSFTFAGQPGAIAVAGDWNGDGRSKVGYYLNGFWALDYDGDGVFTSADKFYAFGGPGPGYVPVVGDWNADGRTKIGFYNSGFWALDTNGDGTFGVSDSFFAFGGNGAGEIPITGDWNGDGRAKIGFYFKGGWVLDYNGDGIFNARDKYYGGFPYALGDKPVVGDWNYNGTTKIGVFRNGFWLLDYNGDGSYETGVDKFYAFSQNGGETPLVADWNGDGRSKIGVYFNGIWVLDYNGDGTYDAGDRYLSFNGGAGSQPLVGRW